MILILFISLFSVTTVMLCVRAWKLYRHFNYLRLYTELMVPTSLYLYYGVFGIVAIFANPDRRAYTYGITFTDLDVLSAFLAMTLAGLSFWLGTHSFPYAKSNATHLRDDSNMFRIFPTESAVLALLAIDLSTRFQKIKVGAYFSWMRGRASDIYNVQPSTLWLLADALAPVILSLMLVLALQRRKIWFVGIAAYFFLMLLSGHRTPMFQGTIAMILTYFYYAQRKIVLRKVLKVGAVAAFTLYLVSSVVTDVRAVYRLDMRAALADPKQFIVDIAVEYIPNSLNPFSERPQVVENTNVASVSERVSLWSQAFSSQIHQINTNGAFLPIDQFFDETTLWIPGFLYPGKPPNTYGSRANDYLGVTGDDPATTIFSSFFLYFWFPGAIIFGFFVGAIWGGVARFLVTRPHGLGPALWFGGTTAFEINSNSFGMFFAALRDYAIILLVFYLAYTFVARLFPLKRYGPPDVPAPLRKIKEATNRG